MNTFLIFAPGDIPRPFLEEKVSDAPRDFSLCRESIVAACRGARSVDSELLVFKMENVLDTGAEDCCIAKLSDGEESGGSTIFDTLINGEDEVR